jgi:putative ABC transport system permease protein
MAITRNIKGAIKSLRMSKWRSLMTMTGIILGIVSVVTTVSLGEGVKRQVVGQINRLGSDLITIRPGNIVSRDNDGNITRIRQLSDYTFASGSLSDGDISTVSNTSGISQTVPINLVNSGARFGSKEYNDGLIIGTNESFPSAVRQKIIYGSFFTAADSKRKVVVIGKKVAEQLFEENVPIGLSLTIRGQDYIVAGVFDQFESSPLAFGTDLNKGIFIPYSVSRDITGNSQLVQILTRPVNPAQTRETIVTLNKNLKAAHGGQDDFTILKQDENLAVAGNVLDLFTAFISGVAAMSLLIGGIGIMNIMLVSVTERTREIGIRKAVGATNRQISSQFFVEAAVLSSIGGVIGIGLAYIVNLLLRIFTHLNPVITPSVVILAAAVSLALGTFFGIIPAFRAARKDPIDALRYE